LEANKIITGDNIMALNSIDDESIHCIVTSPPYFCNMEYEKEDYDKFSHDVIGEWNTFIRGLIHVFTKCYDVLVPGGHLWINIDDSHTSIKSKIGKNIVLPTHSALIMGLHTIYDYKEMVLWKKIRGKHASGGSNRMLGSYGRFGSPGSIPIVQEVEYVLWFKKPGKRKDVTDEMRKASSLTKSEFNSFGMQIWEIQPERDRQHPAPFPVELPYRIIKLSSFEGDLILDPYMGSGSTAIACNACNRNWLGIERDAKYVRIAERRINEQKSIFN